MIIIELGLMIYEIKKIKELKELGIGPQQISEEQRRNKYAKPMSYVSLIAMGAFMILLIIGVAV